jgi:hypothetical protein
MFIRIGNKYIEIKDEMSAINLEIKFNLTTYGKLWGRISNALYYFRDIEVDSSQFTLIKELVESHLDSSNFSIVL